MLVATNSVVSRFSSGFLAVLVNLSAVIQLYARIYFGSFMLERSLITLASVNVLYG